MYAELKDSRVTFKAQNEQFDTSTASLDSLLLKIILEMAELERNMTLVEQVTATMINRAPNAAERRRIPFATL